MNDTDTETEPELLPGKAAEHLLPGGDDEPNPAVDEPAHDSGEIAVTTDGSKRIPWSRLVILGTAPLMAIALVSAAAMLWWHETTVRASTIAQAESTTSARDATVALLSYQPDQVDAQLHAASDLLTGDFKKSYTGLTDDVVIPGAKQRQIASVATVSAVASVSASPRHAVTLVFVDQTVTVGNGAPTATSSAIRVTLDKVENRWLISAFDPI